MSLFDKSLRLALLAGATLLVACPNDGKDETGEETDADTDADTDVDTGVMQQYFAGQFVVPGGEFSTGAFGYSFIGLESENEECGIMATLAQSADEAPGGCPDCDWSFDLSNVDGGLVSGDHCGDIGITDGFFTGYLEYSWGFASEYEYYYAAAGTYLPLTNTVFLNTTGEWFMFAFNYGSTYSVTGDAESSEMLRPAFSSAGDYVYYYYYK